MDVEIDVPQYFLCPISLEIMKDPVTLSTGITYDRDSIEKWLFSAKRNDTCPVTKQSVSDSDLTPNHTLRRLIQAWCTINASHGVERIPTPKPPLSRSQITKLLADAKKSPQEQIACLRKLRSLAAESESNRRCLESSAAVEFLASLILSLNGGDDEEDGGDRAVVDEAVSILYNLQLSESAMKAAVSRRESEFGEALVREMRRRGSFDSRAYAVMLLKRVFDVAEPVTMTCLKPGFFSEVVRVLKDQVSPQATKAALQLLISLCPWGRNRVKAVEAGAVAAAVEMLLETAAATERRRCEMVLAVLELTSGCAEGRAELLGHAAGLAAVSKKVLRVSNAASERAVRVLLAVAKFSATPAVVGEMASIGVVAKMCLVLQVDCGAKTKEKAREILRIHAKSWKNSPCVPNHLLSSYPN